LMYDAKDSAFRFQFNADRLTPKTDYSLIYYADKPDRFVNWMGNYPGAFIDSGKSNNKGEISLKGSVNLGMDLPSLPDINVTFNQTLGAKVWLVLTSDYNKTTCALTAWNPSKYLFDDASRLVQYNDTDVISTKLVQKDPVTYNVTNPDTIFGYLWYTPKGNKFGYKFNGYGLHPTTAYSLIYYADPWAGNHPGALIATGTTDANGFINIPVGAINLGMSLPAPADANHATGAKIWLVPSSDYNAGTKSLTAWNLTNILMETQLIKYKHN